MDSVQLCLVGGNFDGPGGPCLVDDALLPDEVPHFEVAEDHVLLARVHFCLEVLRRNGHLEGAAHEHGQVVAELVVLLDLVPASSLIELPELAALLYHAGAKLSKLWSEPHQEL